MNSSPGRFRVIDQKLGRRFDRRQKPRQARIVQGRGIGDIDQLVIGRHTFLFDVKGAPRPLDDIHLIQLEIAESANHRVDLAGNE